MTLEALEKGFNEINPELSPEKVRTVIRAARSGDWGNLLVSGNGFDPSLEYQEAKAVLEYVQKPENSEFVKSLLEEYTNTFGGAGILVAKHEGAINLSDGYDPLDKYTKVIDQQTSRLNKLDELSKTIKPAEINAKIKTVIGKPLDNINLAKFIVVIKHGDQPNNMLQILRQLTGVLDTTKLYELLKPGLIKNIDDEYLTEFVIKNLDDSQFQETVRQVSSETIPFPSNYDSDEDSSISSSNDLDSENEDSYTSEKESIFLGVKSYRSAIDKKSFQEHFDQLVISYGSDENKGIIDFVEQLTKLCGGNIVDSKTLADKLSDYRIAQILSENEKEFKNRSFNQKNILDLFNNDKLLKSQANQILTGGILTKATEKLKRTINKAGKDNIFSHEIQNIFDGFQIEEQERRKEIVNSNNSNNRLPFTIDKSNEEEVAIFLSSVLPDATPYQKQQILELVRNSTIEDFPEQFIELDPTQKEKLFTLSKNTNFKDFFEASRAIKKGVEIPQEEIKAGNLREPKRYKPGNTIQIDTDFSDLTTAHYNLYLLQNFANKLKGKGFSAQQIAQAIASLRATDASNIAEALQGFFPDGNELLKVYESLDQKTINAARSNFGENKGLVVDNQSIVSIVDAIRRRTAPVGRTAPVAVVNGQFAIDNGGILDAGDIPDLGATTITDAVTLADIQSESVSQLNHLQDFANKLLEKGFSAQQIAQAIASLRATDASNIATTLQGFFPNGNELLKVYESLDQKTINAARSAFGTDKGLVVDAQGNVSMVSTVDVAQQLVAVPENTFAIGDRTILGNGTGNNIPNLSTAITVTQGLQATPENIQSVSKLNHLQDFANKLLEKGFTHQQIAKAIASFRAKDYSDIATTLQGFFPNGNELLKVYESLDQKTINAARSAFGTDKGLVVDAQGNVSMVSTVDVAQQLVAVPENTFAIGDRTILGNGTGNNIPALAVAKRTLTNTHILELNKFLTGIIETGIIEASPKQKAQIIAALRYGKLESLLPEIFSDNPQSGEKVLSKITPELIETTRRSYNGLHVTPKGTIVESGRQDVPDGCFRIPNDPNEILDIKPVSATFGFFGNGYISLSDITATTPPAPTTATTPPAPTYNLKKALEEAGLSELDPEKKARLINSLRAPDNTIPYSINSIGLDSDSEEQKKVFKNFEKLFRASRQAFHEAVYIAPDGSIKAGAGQDGCWAILQDGIGDQETYVSIGGDSFFDNTQYGSKQSEALTASTASTAPIAIKNDCFPELALEEIFKELSEQLSDENKKLITQAFRAETSYEIAENLRDFSKESPSDGDLVIKLLKISSLDEIIKLSRSNQLPTEVYGNPPSNVPTREEIFNQSSDLVINSFFENIGKEIEKEGQFFSPEEKASILTILRIIDVDDIANCLQKSFSKQKIEILFKNLNTTVIKAIRSHDHSAFEVTNLGEVRFVEEIVSSGSFIIPENPTINNSTAEFYQDPQQYNKPQYSNNLATISPEQIKQKMPLQRLADLFDYLEKEEGLKLTNNTRIKIIETIVKSQNYEEARKELASNVGKQETDLITSYKRIKVESKEDPIQQINSFFSSIQEELNRLKEPALNAEQVAIIIHKLRNYTTPTIRPTEISDVQWKTVCDAINQQTLDSLNQKFDRCLLIKPNEVKIYEAGDNTKECYTVYSDSNNYENYAKATENIITTNHRHTLTKKITTPSIEDIKFNPIALIEVIAKELSDKNIASLENFGGDLEIDQRSSVYNILNHIKNSNGSVFSNDPTKKSGINEFLSNITNIINQNEIEKSNSVPYKEIKSKLNEFVRLFANFKPETNEEKNNELEELFANLFDSSGEFLSTEKLEELKKSFRKDNFSNAELKGELLKVLHQFEIDLLEAIKANPQRLSELNDDIQIAILDLAQSDHRAGEEFYNSLIKEFVKNLVEIKKLGGDLDQGLSNSLRNNGFAPLIDILEKPTITESDYQSMFYGQFFLNLENQLLKKIREIVKNNPSPPNINILSGLISETKKIIDEIEKTNTYSTKSFDEQITIISTITNGGNLLPPQNDEDFYNSKELDGFFSQLQKHNTKDQELKDANSSQSSKEKAKARHDVIKKILKREKYKTKTGFGSGIENEAFNRFFERLLEETKLGIQATKQKNKKEAYQANKYSQPNPIYAFRKTFSNDVLGDQKDFISFVNTNAGLLKRVFEGLFNLDGNKFPPVTSESLKDPKQVLENIKILSNIERLEFSVSNDKEKRNLEELKTNLQQLAINFGITNKEKTKLLFTYLIDNNIIPPKKDVKLIITKGFGISDDGYLFLKEYFKDKDSIYKNPNDFLEYLEKSNQLSELEKAKFVESLKNVFSEIESLISEELSLFRQSASTNKDFKDRATLYLGYRQENNEGEVVKIDDKPKSLRRLVKATQAMFDGYETKKGKGKARHTVFKAMKEGKSFTRDKYLQELKWIEEHLETFLDMPFKRSNHQQDLEPEELKEAKTKFTNFIRLEELLPEEMSETEKLFLANELTLFNGTNPDSLFEKLKNFGGFEGFEKSFGITFSDENKFFEILKIVKKGLPPRCYGSLDNMPDPTPINLEELKKTGQVYIAIRKIKDKSFGEEEEKKIIAERFRYDNTDYKVLNDNRIKQFLEDPTVRIFTDGGKSFLTEQGTNLIRQVFGKMETSDPREKSFLKALNSEGSINTDIEQLKNSYTSYQVHDEDEDEYDNLKSNFDKLQNHLQQNGLQAKNKATKSLFEKFSSFNLDETGNITYPDDISFNVENEITSDEVKVLLGVLMIALSTNPDNLPDNLFDNNIPLNEDNRKIINDTYNNFKSQKDHNSFEELKKAINEIDISSPEEVTNRTTLTTSVNTAIFSILAAGGVNGFTKFTGSLIENKFIPEKTKLIPDLELLKAFNTALKEKAKASKKTTGDALTSFVPDDVIDDLIKKLATTDNVYTKVSQYLNSKNINPQIFWAIIGSKTGGIANLIEEARKASLSINGRQEKFSQSVEEVAKQINQNNEIQKLTSTLLISSEAFREEFNEKLKTTTLTNSFNDLTRFALSIIPNDITNGKELNSPFFDSFFNKLQQEGITTVQPEYFNNLSSDDFELKLAARKYILQQYTTNSSVTSISDRVEKELNILSAVLSAYQASPRDLELLESNEKLSQFFKTWKGEQPPTIEQVVRKIDLFRDEAQFRHLEQVTNSFSVDFFNKKKLSENEEEKKNLSDYQQSTGKADSIEDLFDGDGLIKKEVYEEGLDGLRKLANSKSKEGKENSFTFAEIKKMPNGTPPFCIKGGGGDMTFMNQEVFDQTIKKEFERKKEIFGNDQDSIDRALNAAFNDPGKNNKGLKEELAKKPEDLSKLSKNLIKKSWKDNSTRKDFESLLLVPAPELPKIVPPDAGVIQISQTQNPNTLKNQVVVTINNQPKEDTVFIALPNAGYLRGRIAKQDGQFAILQNGKEKIINAKKGEIYFDEETVWRVKKSKDVLEHYPTAIKDLQKESGGKYIADGLKKVDVKTVFVKNGVEDSATLCLNGGEKTFRFNFDEIRKKEDEKMPSHALTDQNIKPGKNPSAPLFGKNLQQQKNQVITI